MPGKAYPLTSYFFKVTIGNTEMGFQSITGLSASLEVEDFMASGENRFTYKLPKQTTYTNLILKRGLIKDTEIINWCEDAFYNQRIELRDLTISLLDKDKNPVTSWKVINAYPKKWEVSEFNAQSSAIAVETLELQYQYFEFS